MESRLTSQSRITLYNVIMTTCLHIDTERGLLAEAQYIASANKDERPAGTPLDLIVVHNISLPPGEFGGPYVEQLFTNTLSAEEHPYFAEIHEMKVSAHLFVRRDGQLIQFVPFHERAWHAGQSTFHGRDRCNDFSIGIELEGDDDTPYEQVQYEQLAAAIQALQLAYSIDPEHLAGHCDIAPGRKTDPGAAFDWAYLQSCLAKSEQNAETET